MRFDALTWGNGFAEGKLTFIIAFLSLTCVPLCDKFLSGNSWHHSFPAWSIESLAQMHGGKAKLLRKLHELLTIPSTFGVGSYGQVRAVVN